MTPLPSEDDESETESESDASSGSGSGSKSKASSKSHDDSESESDSEQSSQPLAILRQKRIRIAPDNSNTTIKSIQVETHVIPPEPGKVTGPLNLPPDLLFEDGFFEARCKILERADVASWFRAGRQGKESEE